MAGACGMYGEDKYMVLVKKKTEGKKPLGKTGRRWEDDNKGSFKEIG